MAEKIQFFPLDVTYRIIGDKAVIHLFGRTVKGEQICVIDDNFQPYFYVLPKKNIEDLKKKIEAIKVEKKEGTSEVIKAEAVKKKILGEECELIKVYTKLPQDVPVIRDILKGWDLVKSTREFDINFSFRYLIDKRIVPTTLIQAKGEFLRQQLKVPVFKAEKLSQFSDDTLEEPRMLAFDIETYNPHGKNIEPEINPIIMVSFYGDKFKKVVTWKRFKTTEDYIEFVDGEAELIEKFKEVLLHYKPDIITGYFSDGFDFPYIKKRAEKYKIKMDIGLDNSELKIKKGAIITKSQITGITHVDVFRFIIKILGKSLDTELYNLDSIAKEMLGEEKEKVNLDELAHVWDKDVQKLEQFCKYNLHDSYLAYKLCQKMLPNIIELVKIIGLPLYDINRMGFSQLVEWYIMKQAQEFNEISPNKPDYNEIGERKQHTYKGAFVYEPKPGFYNDLVVFDYRSLYPTIISSHNISPGTLNCECCKGTAEAIPSENKKFNYWFCTKKKGFIPTIIEDLITRRMRIKEIMENKESELLHARENSLKLLANSFYGYLGFYGARWYSIECARSVTSLGRFYIHKVIDKAVKSGFKVVYSDTDSVFLTLDGKTKKSAMKFAEEINLELPGLMELEYDGFYPKGIFVYAKIGEFGAKKKYALISDEGIIKIKGFETVRRNWSFIAKEVQEEVLRIILQEDDKAKALEYVKKVINDLRENKIPLEKVIIHTQLQKDIESYENRGPHVFVAETMKKQGLHVGPGTMIKYIIIRGSEKIRDRARLASEVSQKEYDPNYYINNQIIPSVERIFNVIGFKKDDLLITKDQSNLGKFF